MSLLGAVVRKIDPKTAINYFRRNLMGSGSLGRKEISKIHFNNNLPSPYISFLTI